MQLDIFCTNCKEHVLQADTDTLTSPLVGHMFKIKRDMEWSMFSPHDVEINLACPLCEWLIHENGKIRVVFNGDILIDMPDKVVNTILARIGIKRHVEHAKKEYFYGKSFPEMVSEAKRKNDAEILLYFPDSPTLTHDKELVLPEGTTFPNPDAGVQGTVEPHTLLGGSTPPSATNSDTVDPVKAKIAEKKETFTEKIKQKIKKRKRGRPKKKSALQKMGLEK